MLPDQRMNGWYVSPVVHPSKPVSNPLVSGSFPVGIEMLEAAGVARSVTLLVGTLEGPAVRTRFVEGWFVGLASMPAVIVRLSEVQ